MSRGYIVAVGSINVDFQVLAERWPQPGETLLVRKFLMHGGGKGANIAYLARRFGVESMVIGRIGSDLLQQEALRPLMEAGVDVSQVKPVRDKQTGVALIIVQPDAEKVIFLATNANDAWSEGDKAEVAATIARAPNGSILVIDLEVPTGIVREAMVAARGRGFKVILDPSPAERMAQDLYASANFMTPNGSEAQQLTGIEVRSVEQAYRAGNILVSRGVGIALVKLGADGCVLVDRRTAQHIPGLPVHAIDTTSAGDAFAGGLAVALIEGRSAHEAVHFAVATSALTVTRFGSQPAYPTRDEVEKVLRSGPLKD